MNVMIIPLLVSRLVLTALDPILVDVMMDVHLIAMDIPVMVG